MKSTAYKFLLVAQVSIPKISFPSTLVQSLKPQTPCLSSHIPNRNPSAETLAIPSSHTAIYLVLPPHRPCTTSSPTIQYIKREDLYACSTTSGQRPLCEPTPAAKSLPSPVPATRHDLPPWPHKRSRVTCVRWLTASPAPVLVSSHLAW
jgi:hypothetical protein